MLTDRGVVSGRFGLLQSRTPPADRQPGRLFSVTLACPDDRLYYRSHTLGRPECAAGDPGCDGGPAGHAGRAPSLAGAPDRATRAARSGRPAAAALAGGGPTARDDGQCAAVGVGGLDDFDHECTAPPVAADRRSNGG